MNRFPHLQALDRVGAEGVDLPIAAGLLDPERLRAVLERHPDAVVLRDGRLHLLAGTGRLEALRHLLPLLYEPGR